jgi:hypothetical protein
MKIGNLYAAEFKPGGENKCAVCMIRKCHGIRCAFCIDKDLREIGVSAQTMRIASAVFRSSSSREKRNQAMESINQEYAAVMKCKSKP